MSHSPRRRRDLRGDGAGSPKRCPRKLVSALESTEREQKAHTLGRLTNSEIRCAVTCFTSTKNNSMPTVVVVEHACAPDILNNTYGGKKRGRDITARHVVIRQYHAYLDVAEIPAKMKIDRQRGIQGSARGPSIRRWGAKSMYFGKCSQLRDPICCHIFHIDEK